jgi:hypothetical protein
LTGRIAPKEGAFIADSHYPEHRAAQPRALRLTRSGRSSAAPA